MATKIITKNSSTTTSVPTAGDLVQGELAVNVTDKRLFTENASAAIVELGTNPSTLTSGAATFSGYVDVSGANPANTLLGQVSVKSTTALANGNASGISFWANTSTGLGAYASIQTVTTGDYAGKLVFTTRNGAGVFDPRMTIDASGNLLVGKTANDNTTAGHRFTNAGFASHVVANDYPLLLNRLSSDGALLTFRKDSTTVGIIQSRAGVVSTIILDPRTNGAGLTGSTNGLIPVNQAGSTADNHVDLGSSSSRFKDLYLSGTAKLNFINHGETIYPTTDAAVDIGTSGERYRNLYLSGTVNAGAATFSGRVSVNGATNPNSSLAILSDSGANAAEIRTRATYNDYAFINFNSTDGSEALGALGVHRTAAATASLIFYSNDGTAGVNEAGRFDASGNLLVNTTSLSAAATTAKLQVDSEILSVGSSAGLFWTNRSGTVSSSTNWAGWYSTSTNHFLYSNGANKASIGITSGTYTALSDANKKKDLEDSTVGLDAVMKLKPKTYRMLEDADDAPKYLGFIAQDVEHIIPEAYVENTSVDAGGMESTFIGLTDRPFIAALVKAMQEQQAIIESQATSIAALTARLDALEGA